MQMSFPHTCIVSHFSLSPRVRETNPALPARPVPRLSLQQEEAASPTQPLSCARVMPSCSYAPSPKRTISEHLTQPREPTEVALLPPQIWSPDTAVPVSLGWERMQTAPTSMNFPNWNSPLRKDQWGKRINLHLTQEREDAATEHCMGLQQEIPNWKTFTCLENTQLLSLC